jgi:SAM-dependent methyltransferase
MEFYKALSHVYDIVFPASPQTVEFIAERVGAGGRVLDAACGTGGHAIALAARGRRVAGIDVDESMIARAAAKKAGGSVTFLKGDMSRLDFLPSGAFDGIYCIGNSLVHLSDTATVEQTLRGFAERLAEDGTVIVQIVNFDRILSRGIVELPPIEREEEGVTFRRRYDFDAAAQTVSFRGELIQRTGERTVTSVERIPLLVLTSADLVSLVKAAGLQEVELYGAFDGRPYSADAPAVVVCAHYRAAPGRGITPSR